MARTSFMARTRAAAADSSIRLTLSAARFDFDKPTLERIVLRALDLVAEGVEDRPAAIQAAEEIAPMPVIALLTKKMRESTFWLEMHFHRDREPIALFKALAAIGWTEEGGFREPPPLIAEYRKRNLSKNGTAIFNGFTVSEARRFKKELLAALADNGVAGIYEKQLTLADLL